MINQNKKINNHRIIIIFFGIDFEIRDERWLKTNDAILNQPLELIAIALCGMDEIAILTMNKIKIKCIVELNIHFTAFIDIFIYLNISPNLGKSPLP